MDPITISVFLKGLLAGAGKAAATAGKGTVATAKTGKPLLTGAISKSGSISKASYDTNALGGLLKSMMSGSGGQQQQAASIPMGIPGIEAPIPSNIQFGGGFPMPQYQAPTVESLMYGRRRYGNG